MTAGSAGSAHDCAANSAARRGRSLAGGITRQPQGRGGARNTSLALATVTGEVGANDGVCRLVTGTAGNTL